MCTCTMSARKVESKWDHAKTQFCNLSFLIYLRNILRCLFFSMIGKYSVWECTKGTTLFSYFCYFKQCRSAHPCTYNCSVSISYTVPIYKGDLLFDYIYAHLNMYCQIVFQKVAPNPGWVAQLVRASC